jgi:hypothetical protein
MTPNQIKQGKDLSDHLENIKKEEEAKKRTEDCQKELAETLKKYNCALDAVMILSRNGAVPQITIVAQ